MKYLSRLQYLNGCFSTGTPSWYIEGLVNNIVCNNRYEGCSLQKNCCSQRQSNLQFDTTNKYEYKYKNYGFLNDTVSTPEYVETMRNFVAYVLPAEKKSSKQYREEATPRQRN